jgi:transposase
LINKSVYSLSGDILHLFYLVLFMKHIRKKFLAKGFDAPAYKRAYHRCQQDYLRLRLRCVKAFADGHEFRTIASMLGKSEATCRSIIQLYLDGGLERVCLPDTRHQPSSLSAEQAAAFRNILLTSRPCDKGLEGNIWTGQTMRAFLAAEYTVVYKSGIYDLLERLGLSHQRAHADYGNAIPEDQAVFLEDVKHTLNQADERHAVVSFDEFSVGAIPTPFYGWAPKNTRPTVKTDEKKDNEPTGCSASTF